KAQAGIGDVVGDAARSAELAGSVREACEIARRAGARVDPDAVFTRIKSLPPGMKSSMQKDIAENRVPELEAIAGPVLSGTKKYGFPVPVTEGLVDALRRVTKTHPGA